MNDILDDLFQYIDSLGIKARLMYLNPFTPSACNPHTKRIAVNMNWYNRAELPFQVAHEIGHILNEDDACILYYSTDVSKSKIEHAANSKALDILIPRYFRDCDYENANVANFMNELAVPTRMEEEAKKKTADYFDR
jgi:Zn-dependent peptidase ImmA (M78 family)